MTIAQIGGMGGGTAVHSGSDYDEIIDPNAGDLYFHVGEGNLYKFVDGAWEYQITYKGSRGSVIWDNLSPMADVGDLAFIASGKFLYRFTESIQWELIGSLQGNLWQTGNGDPTSNAVIPNQGGDLYLNTANGDVYVANGAGVWTLSTNLKGPPGADGAAGPAGPAGATGPAGAGLPVGGTTGQIAAKASNADHDVEWVDAPTGSGGGTLDFATISAMNRNRQPLYLFDDFEEFRMSSAPYERWSKIFGAYYSTGGHTHDRPYGLSPYPADKFFGAQHIYGTALNARTSGQSNRAFIWTDRAATSQYVPPGVVYRLACRFRFFNNRQPSGGDFSFHFGFFGSAIDLSAANDTNSYDKAYFGLQMNFNCPTNDAFYIRHKTTTAASVFTLIGPATTGPHIYEIEVTRVGDNSTTIKHYFDGVEVSAATVTNAANLMTSGVGHVEPMFWIWNRALLSQAKGIDFDWHEASITLT